MNPWFEKYAYFNIVVISWEKIWIQMSFTKCWHCHLFWSSNSTEHIQPPFHISKWTINKSSKKVQKDLDLETTSYVFLSSLMIAKRHSFQPQLVERRKQKNLCERMAADLAKWWAHDYILSSIWYSIQYKESIRIFLKSDMNRFLQNGEPRTTY